MTTTIIIASVLAYFLIGILAFCWGIRNVLLDSGRPQLYDDYPSSWFAWLDGGDIFFCFIMGMFWPITFLVVSGYVVIANIARWIWTHLLVKIITKSIERKLRKEKKTEK